jgi:hypothetical protein
VVNHGWIRSGLGLGVWLVAAGAVAQVPPPYGDTAGTVFDILRRDDPSALQCLDPMGQDARQIWDKRVDGEPVVEAFLFMARYADGTNIEIAVNPEYQTPDAALTEARRFAFSLGQLPTALRVGIGRFSIHRGDEGFHAGTGQIVVYADRADQRDSYDHLEESLFHEAVHATWDEAHRLSEGWQAAQQADGRFLTGYGARHPDREDLAETALFAFAILHHPERFPPVDTADTVAAVPNRIAYIRTLLPPGQPLQVQVAEAMGCLSG